MSYTSTGTFSECVKVYNTSGSSRVFLSFTPVVSVDGKSIYKTNRGWRTRPSIHASGQPNIHLSAGPVGPHEGGYWAGRERG